MQACGFCEKYNEKRDQPLKPFRALIEFDFDAKLILDNDFEVLLINPYAQLVGFRLVFVGNPDLLSGQIDACRIELVGSVVDLVAVFLQLRFIGRIGLCGLTQV